MNCVTNKRVYRAIAICATVGCLAFWGQFADWSFAGCQAPNPNSKLCTSLPPDAVTQCQWPCDGTIYTINNFPDGTVPSQSGSTAEAQADCWQSGPCQLSEDLLSCATVLMGSWHAGTKVVGGTAQCPPPG